jgi:membrane associated rhomboid family serine protease
VSDATQGNSDARAGTGAGGGQLGVLLACFDKLKAAARLRRGLDEQLRSGGATLLDTVVVQVNAKHRASVHDPRRDVQGALTAALTWGVFGLLSGGLKSLAIWAILGAICGGLYAYFSEHLLSKSELARVGTRLPANSSALLTFAATSDPRSLLEAAAAHAPSAVSVAAVGDDLAARVFTGPAGTGNRPPAPAGRSLAPSQAALSMITVRYPDPATAKRAASRAAPRSKKVASPVQVELVIWTGRDGHRHVADPAQGVKAWATADMVSWGGFGLVTGALAGATGGGGVHSFVSNAIVTGIGWAIFGLVAGALYGLWAGRAVSARRLKSLGPFVAPGTSMLVAWADGPLRQDTIGTLTAPGSQQLILRFNPVDGGALLEAA